MVHEHSTGWCYIADFCFNMVIIDHAQCVVMYVDIAPSKLITMLKNNRPAKCHALSIKHTHLKSDSCI